VQSMANSESDGKTWASALAIRIRRVASNPSIIAITAYPSEEVQHRIREAGVHGFDPVLGKEFFCPGVPSKLTNLSAAACRLQGFPVSPRESVCFGDHLKLVTEGLECVQC
jgi:hypothetical protein